VIDPQGRRRDLLGLLALDKATCELILSRVIRRTWLRVLR
jgi:hypothetical protein